MLVFVTGHSRFGTRMTDGHANRLFYRDSTGGFELVWSSILNSHGGDKTLVLTSSDGATFTSLGFGVLQVLPKRLNC